MAKLADAWSFRDRKIAALKKQPFAKLAALPESQALTVPRKLKGLDVFVRRRTGEHGGMEVTVSVERGSMASTDGFEILPSGRIIPLNDDIAGEKPRKRRAPGEPARLPRDIKSRVLQYLRLEYGESPRDPGALRLSDLSYEGEHLHQGVPTRFWSYPSSAGKTYVTVALSPKEYRIAMSDRGPPKPPGRRTTKSRRV
jgi:hypothetical protein